MVRSAISIVLVCGLAASSGMASGADKASGAPRPSASRFLEQNPGVRFYTKPDGPITSVYGRAFSSGDTARASADAFTSSSELLFGVPAAELKAGSIRQDGEAELGLMPDRENGGLKFTMVSYVQQRDGLPVFRADLRVLTRNEAGFPTVLARSALADLGDWRPNVGAANDPKIDRAFADAERRLGGLTNVDDVTPVIFAGTVDERRAPVTAFSFIAQNGNAGDDGYAKYLFVADASTGRIIWGESLITHVDVTGSVKGNTSDGIKAAFCEPESVKGLPYSRVTIGATETFADVNGNFTVPNAGSGQVTVQSGVRGKWFRVFSPNSDATVLSVNVTPPGPANFVHNQANNSEKQLAEVNSYLHSNIVRDWALLHNPTFPTIGNQQAWRVNVMVSGTCNAFYDGSSINFYASGGGCPNTAWTDVVYHEYGHHLVAVAGSGQGAYGEGYGDLAGVLITDQPVLGYGFFNDCNGGLRDARVGKQYPCSGEIHDCGQLLSGCFWDTRNELVNTEPATYKTLLSDWATNSVVLHTGTEIAPDITIDVLTLDDNDSDLGNGTPHYSEIAAGFNAHNMDAPPLDLLDFSYPDGLPTSISNVGVEEFTVQVVGHGIGVPQENTGLLWVDAENDGTYVSYSMPQLSPNLYSAVFPPVTCGASVRYYVSAKTTTNLTERDPSDAPQVYHSAIAATSFIAVVDENFQTSGGFVATGGAARGLWQRGVPVDNGVSGDPLSDFDGSGSCWLTGNSTGDSDVDEGFVYLTSPTYDLSAISSAAYLSYARWFSNDKLGKPRNDVMYVEASNDAGATWKLVEKVAEDSSEAKGGWYQKSFQLSGILPVNNRMKFRFRTADQQTLNLDSEVEMAIDAFKIITGDCTPCDADFNGDGFLNGDDFDAFSAAFELGDVSADYNGDGFVSGDDFDVYAEDFNAGC